MTIRILALLVSAIGVLFFYGAYEELKTEHLRSVTPFVLAAVHLLCGLGLVWYKSWARLWLLFLCFFYLCLGVLMVKAALPLVDFIPWTPLLKHVPVSMLAWNPNLLSVILLFVIPVATGIYLNLKPAAVYFEPRVRKTFSWEAPILIILAGAFIFSYSLLIPSKWTY